MSKHTKRLLEPFYTREVEECVTKIVDLLEQGATLHTKDIIDLMSGVRFSEDFIKYVHAMVCRRLFCKGLVLACYPHIIPPYDQRVIRTDGYVYQVVPFEFL